MSIFREIRVGDAVPNVQLGRLVNGEPQGVWLHDLIGDDNALIFGVPGAFTPTCTQRHIPDMVTHAERLKAAGLAHIICLVPNNPWAITAWAGQLDPQARLTFLSDGNLEFARLTGLATTAHDQFLGVCSKRYRMQVGRRGVLRLSVEADTVALTCTLAAQVGD